MKKIVKFTNCINSYTPERFTQLRIHTFTPKPLKSRKKKLIQTRSLLQTPGIVTFGGALPISTLSNSNCRYKRCILIRCCPFFEREVSLWFLPDQSCYYAFLSIPVALILQYTIYTCKSCFFSKNYSS